MSVEFVDGNIFESGSEAICNAVNCRGVMGAGLARSFADRFPDMYGDYQKACSAGDLTLGALHTWKVAKKSTGPGWIVNFPTMDMPGEHAKRETLEDGFNALVQFVNDKNIKSISIPALGCGIGRFPWDDFRAMAHEFAKRVPNVQVKVYKPHERK